MSFWKEKTLDQMTSSEWESLCDGCAKCCLEKLEDIQTGEISFTNVACSLLDLKTCHCTNYVQRQRFMPECVPLTPDNVSTLKWMPSTCAYRLLAQGDDLPDWHPLVTGNFATVIQAGVSVKGRVVSEQDAGDLEDHIVDWSA